MNKGEYHGAGENYILPSNEMLLKDSHATKMDKAKLVCTFEK